MTLILQDLVSIYNIIYIIYTNNICNDLLKQIQYVYRIHTLVTKTNVYEL